MKKWVAIILGVIFLAIGMSVFVYVQATAPLKAAEKIAIEQAKVEADLVSVVEVYIYNGNESSAAVKGINQEQEEIIVFIPHDGENIVVKKASDGITKEQAIEIVRAEKNPKEIVSVKLGIEKKIPLWEIHYTSEESALNYYYIDFQTGDWLKKIENL